VVRQGELGGDLYLCLRGELIVVHSPPAGDPREVARLHHGGLFGELAVMTGEPRTATVQAASACELLVVRKAALAQVLSASPAFADLISRRMAERQAALDAIDRQTSPDQRRVSIEQHKQRFLRRLRDFFAP
jgi:CRP-like cAMP-binding protein